ncbi:leucyl/phenylalanyl-tRNA--protein transferase [Chitinilyticum piscinae]|uniref:Leucyl/phenylalanyl-tRNA--protein transferase n=1 Tax=Chitinilyticum piscinae TaxID=2866724 RepID=A0A8J7FU82_9NEIS|nr:leucyl/phenylalanyl-tRNA--protein transferase [Chitinilyticum piscinae]MBE9610671.1 leucyl/phenylalanyl-tRNA--protein transferase [Chitinilyticum piscinae]
MIPWLDHSLQFPPLAQALREPNGLLAAGGDLSPARLLLAYRQGIFPWFAPGEPILWWSPSPRMVLHTAELHVPRSLQKVLRNRHYEVRLDTAFARVIAGCAAPRDEAGGSWITREMQAAYLALHQAGHAHCAECWIDGELAGGLYGVAIGRMFYGESMYTSRPDASKIAFVHLVCWLRERGFAMIDCQMRTHHLARFGAREIPRNDFVAHLERACNVPGLPGPWCYTAGSGCDA